jgi:hypothetical protein
MHGKGFNMLIASLLLTRVYVYPVYPSIGNPYRHFKGTLMPNCRLFYTHILSLSLSEVGAVTNKRSDMLLYKRRIPFPDVLQGCPDSLSSAHLRWCM